MRKTHLLGIAPYEGLYHLMVNLAAQRNDVKLTVRMGNLDEALELAVQNESDPVDAIISRGGTSDVLRRVADIPVYDASPSVYDILRTIRLAQEMGEPFAVVGFPTITKPARTLCEIMKYGCEVRTIRSEADCGDVLRELAAKGTRLIVGDTISVQYCRELDLHGLLIVSGIESVEAAIDSALEMIRHYDTVAKRAFLLSDLINTSQTPVILFAADGREILRSSQGVPEELAAFLRERISHVMTQRAVKLSRRLGSSYYSIQGRRLVSGDEEYCIFSLLSRPASSADKYHIRFLTAEEPLSGSHPLEFYLGSGSYGEGLRSLCERYAAIDAPVLLTGPRGTGKGRLAHYIYTRSGNKHSSLVWIDVSELTDKGWDFLLDSEASPLLDAGQTVFFRNVNRLASPQARVLLAYLRNAGTAKVNRLIFSYESMEAEPVGDELYYFLTEELRCSQLHTLPISRRTQDIQPLVGLCINTFNVHYGTQVVGLSHGALLAIQNREWPHNIDQLVQFISRLVAGSGSAYISEEEVRQMLSEEKRASLAAQKGLSDLSGSLNDITREIVRQVYLEEGMNQTRTAERLGISRSTVWRMLKE
ncbi:MAG: PrpR N-terminal domain-containing protein [Oscillospiraceae bacterium]|nr:PrpR N-terminal domain-containing protein [Oscillospiraceae bacterium]